MYLQLTCFSKTLATVCALEGFRLVMRLGLHVLGEVSLSLEGKVTVLTVVWTQVGVRPNMRLQD